MRVRLSFGLASFRRVFFGRAGPVKTFVHLIGRPVCYGRNSIMGDSAIWFCPKVQFGYVCRQIWGEVQFGYARSILEADPAAGRQ